MQSPPEFFILNCTFSQADSQFFIRFAYTVAKSKRIAMPKCERYPADEEYADFILRYTIGNPESLIRIARTECINFISYNYAVVHALLERVTPISIYRHSYNAIPKIYGLLDITALESSGIPSAVNHPILQANGRGVILGIIDTGIDYTSSLFRNPDGTSRILSIWDQTIPSGMPDELTNGFQPFYGTVYDQDQINAALKSDDPYQSVPSKDTNGHGTFLAGVAASNQIEQPIPFSGAAPKADLAVVKLKPAKQYLRDFFLIPSDVPAFQENDIMAAVNFLLGIATRYFRPLVILIGVGTSQGNHDGTSPLGFQLRSLRGVTGLSIVTGAGNEVGYHHHFYGTITAGQSFEDVELRVAQQDPGFCLEFWADGPEIYTIGFISPSGETVERIPIELGSEVTIPFRLDATQITVNYQLYEAGSGNQLIFMRFQTPAQGIWHIRVYPADQVSGNFHMWLPLHGFITEDTIFLRPNPNTTITDPGNVPNLLTVGAYNHLNNSIFIHSSRGYTSTGLVKPDLAAPGVDIQGPVPSLPETFTRKTGTSVAAALTAGAAADLLTRAIVDKNNETATGAAVKSLLIRGADRNPALQYPNREWGYGTLNLYQSFTQI